MSDSGQRLEQSHKDLVGDGVPASGQAQSTSMTLRQLMLNRPIEYWSHLPVGGRQG